MTMTARDVSSMYAQIVRGVPKEQSQYVTDEESSQEWDTIQGQVNEILERNPQAIFSIPNEMPDADDDGEEPDAADTPEPQPDTGGDEPDGAEPPAEAPDGDEQPAGQPEEPPAQAPSTPSADGGSGEDAS